HASDRLGSVRAAPWGYDQWTQGVAASSYFPYGQARTGGSVFGTYLPNSTTGTMYAMHREYSAVYGRFLTPDPYQASGGPADPGSWNRYSYVQGDPVNLFDPAGLSVESAGDGCTWDTSTSTLNCRISGISFSSSGGFDPAWMEKKMAGRMQSWDVLGSSLRVSLLQQNLGVVAPTDEGKAKLLQGAVAKGDLSDCQALAMYANAVALTDNDHGNRLPYSFVDHFGVFVQADNSAVSLATSMGVHIASTNGAYEFKPKGLSGFAEMYRDGASGGFDQVHHFAAFFQLGFEVGQLLGTAGSIAHDLIDNFGDVNLGNAAVKMGADLAAGRLAPIDVSNSIQNLCRK
ncbi:MAG: hypothetical protein NTY38_09115, partial [Acidobacteria bacterium]|nr:hypothetical protein [Acidobacteriota bacterium]